MAIKGQIKTICYECNTIIKDGSLLKGRASHGLCNKCKTVIINYLEGKDYDKNYAAKLKTINP